MFTASQYTIYAILPQLDVDSIETDDNGRVWASIGHYDEDDRIHCRVRLHMKGGYLHSPKRGNQVGPAVIAQLYNTIHNEYRRSGFLHNWHGPALQHGDEVEYWLYGCRFEEADHARLTFALDKHRCDTDFGQMNRICDFDSAEFIDHCYAKNLKAVLVCGKNNAKHRRERENQQRHREREARLTGQVIRRIQEIHELEATVNQQVSRIQELEGQLQAMTRVALFFGRAQ